jgi:hypothetical protein
MLLALLSVLRRTALSSAPQYSAAPPTTENPPLISTGTNRRFWVQACGGAVCAIRWNDRDRKEAAMAQPEEDMVIEAHLAPDERDPEAPAEDAVQQATAADPADGTEEVHRGLEVDDWDAVEQARVVAFDDEYR